MGRNFSEGELISGYPWKPDSTCEWKKYSQDKYPQCLVFSIVWGDSAPGIVLLCELL